MTAPRKITLDDVKRVPGGVALRARAGAPAAEAQLGREGSSLAGLAALIAKYGKKA